RVTGGAAAQAATASRGALSLEGPPRLGRGWECAGRRVTPDLMGFQYWKPMRSWVTLLTAYGDSGRSGFVSTMGNSSGYTSPYSSPDPMTRKRAREPSCRIASKRFICPIALVMSVSAGVCHDAPTNDCAARWMM